MKLPASFVALGFLAGCASSVGPGSAFDAALDSPSVVSDVGPDEILIFHTTPARAVPITCPADAGVTFPAAITACNVASDCVAVVHGLDCCGSSEIVGINRTQ